MLLQNIWLKKKLDIPLFSHYFVIRLHFVQYVHFSLDLTGNLHTFWVITSSELAWAVIDLHTEHTLTGITINGW